ncbi:MAG: FG-GAP repeat domain-containing protein, partial [Myxococcota bacterium]
SALTLHRNLGDGWDLDAPDQTFQEEQGVTSYDLLDLDGDGRAELVSVRVPTGVLELVEMLATRAVDALVTIYKRGSDEPFDTDPWITSKQDIGISFETLRPTGFIPTSQADLNGDGLRDLLGSGDGERVEVRLGDREKGFAKKTREQKLDTGGSINFGDLDRDGSSDFVLYDARRPGTPIRIGVSQLGTRPQLTPAED